MSGEAPVVSVAERGPNHDEYQGWMGCSDVMVLYVHKFKVNTV